MDKITANILAEVTGRMLPPFTETGKPGTSLMIEYYKFQNLKFWGGGES